MTAVTMAPEDAQAEELFRIAELYENIRSYFNSDKMKEAEKVFQDNSQLFVKHWIPVLCMTGLSHDFVVTKLCIVEILKSLPETAKESFFKFLLNLDRLLEIDSMQQMNGMLEVQKETEFIPSLDFIRATRQVIRYSIEEDLKVCVLPKSNVHSYIGHH